MSYIVSSTYQEAARSIISTHLQGVVVREALEGAAPLRVFGEGVHQVLVVSLSRENRHPPPLQQTNPHWGRPWSSSM